MCAQATAKGESLGMFLLFLGKHVYLLPRKIKFLQNTIQKTSVVGAQMQVNTIYIPSSMLGVFLHENY